MLCRVRLPLVVLSLPTALVLSGLLQADEKQPPSRAQAEFGDMEFEVKKRELAIRMAEHGIEEAKISLQRIELQLKKAESMGTEDDTARLTLDHKQAALHVEMRKLEAEAAYVELDQAKTRLSQLRKAVKPLPTLDGPVQLEFLEDLDVIVTSGGKEDVEKVGALIQKLEGKGKVDSPVDDEQAAATERLLKERRDILRQMVEFVEGQYRLGRVQHTDMVRASESLIEADLELATDKTKRIALRERRVDNMKELEEFTKAQQQVGRAVPTELFAAKAARLQAEIDLLRERAKKH